MVLEELRNISSEDLWEIRGESKNSKGWK